MGSPYRQFCPVAKAMELLDERWTCRQFRPDPVPRADIERLLALAQRTPSWCNTQPWQVVVTSGEATDRLRAGLAEHVMSHPQEPDFAFPAAYAGVFRDRRRECGFQLYDSVGITKDDSDRRLEQMLRNFDLFDAPHVAILTTEGVARRVVAVGDAIAVHHTCVLGLSYDHRALDGVVAARFLAYLRDALQDRDWEAELA